MATPKKGGKGGKGGKKSSNSDRAGLTFPVGRCGSMLRKGRYQRRVSHAAAVFMAATLEYLTAETLELACKSIDKKKRLTPRGICLAVRNDTDLGDLMANATISRGGVPATKVEKKEKKKKGGKKGGKKAKKDGASPKKAKKSGGKKKAGKKAKK
mgnify:CR=1 FL=1